MTFLFYLLCLIGIYSAFFVLYHVMLALVHFLPGERTSACPGPSKRFAVVIPAHNEELLLPRLLQSLKNQDYDRERFSVIVVADNCTDATAAIAKERGAVVLERNDRRHAGKGHAIRFALENADQHAVDACLIIDADSIAAPDLLTQLNLLLLEGKAVIQCYNGLANPDDSWFTRLLDVSRTMGNEVYHPAKQKLGLSSYLMGNGMCFAKEVLAQYGWNAFSVGEDWEYYAKLIHRGETIAFARNARVYHRESSTLKQATSQRMRWSSGRFAVAGKYGISLFVKGLRERNIKKMDASLPLLLPNPSLGTNIIVAGFGLSFLLPAESQVLISRWFLSLLALQLLLFMTGIAYTRKRMKNFLSLFIAPLFLAWKMAIDVFSLMGMGRSRWVRTERKT
jgi:cellulose synthase/poly-beta-1,6-N-acetylglucosamine synthase-like glycosyltransferase